MDFKEIDKKLDGGLSTRVFLVSFVNDQIYNKEMELMEILPKSGLFKGIVRKNMIRIHSSVNAYNKTCYENLMKKSNYILSIILSNLESLNKPCIDGLEREITLFLEKNGVGEPKRKIVAKAQVLNVLCQVNRVILEEARCILRGFGKGELMDIHSMARQEALSEKIVSALYSYRGNLNAISGITKAFNDLSLSLMNHDNLERAIKDADREIKLNGYEK